MGTTLVRASATDDAGNAASCTFQVAVLDSTPPALTRPAAVSAEATSALGAVVAFPPAQASDAVSEPPLEYDRASGASFTIGMTRVGVTARDAAGNASHCSFTVEVRDTTPPTIECPEATSPQGAAVSIPALRASDAVSTPTVTLAPAGRQFPLGETIVTATARDAAGNPATCREGKQMSRSPAVSPSPASRALRMRPAPRAGLGARRTRRGAGRRSARLGDAAIILPVGTCSTDSTLSRDWVRRYLAFLGVARRAPDAAALAELTRAHVLTVPFENVTSLLRRRAHAGRPVPPVDADELLARWEQGRSGGVCYEIADLFGRLLAGLGYRVHAVLGYITFPGSHQALLVQSGDTRFLVDVGNGAPFFEPIPLRDAVELRRAGLAYRFRSDVASGDWIQERLIDGAWAQFCRYALHEPDPAAREAAYQRHHTPGETWVTGSLTMIRCEEEQVLLLRDEELSRFSAAGKQTERISTLADYARVAAETLKLPALPIAEGVGAWREAIAPPGGSPPPARGA